MSSPEKSELVRALEFAFEPEESAHAVIGPYKLLEKIGEGGFGVVWMAEQQEPVRRPVALKIIKTGMDTRELIARFEAERQALALMDHPNIARVFDARATEAGRPYFVMELVRGTTITQFCDENRVPTEARLRLFIDVCQAVQHAHQKGIIHRDLKPSNILITLHDGKPVAKIIDFGIAKALGGMRLTDKTLFTRFHTFIGTPAYTSPEQIEMSGLDVDTRSDIYSLGVLLYELLAGRPPFDAEQLNSGGLDEARRTILEVDPPRPSQRLRTFDAATRDTIARQRGTESAELALVLRGDLDWVVMRCLEKDRARRYESAAALAADVERHLAHEPVIARPPSASYALQKLVRRHRGAFAAAGAIAAVLVIGAVVSTWQAFRATEAEREQSRLREEAQRAHAAALKARDEAERQELTARRRAYASDMNVLQQALAEGNLARARTLLDRQRPQAGETDLRDWEWRYLWQSCQPDFQSVLAKREQEFGSIAASPDGKWLATGPSPIMIWNRQTGTREEVPMPGFSISHVALAPREPLLAMAAYRTSPAKVGHVVLLNLDTRQTVREWTFSKNGDDCTGLFFSEDGQTLVTSTASAQNEINLWRVATGEKQESFQTEPTAGQPRYAFFAVTPDLKLAAYVSRGEYNVHVIDLVTRRELWSAKVGDDWVTALRFSPDGRILATGEAFHNSPIRLWDALSGVELGRMEGNRRSVTQLVFWPDGKTLASSGGDQTVRLWDVENRRLKRTLRGHTLEVFSLALLPDNTTLVSGSKNGELLLWDTTAAPAAQATTIPGTVMVWRFSGDGDALITVESNGRVAERRGENYREERTLLDLGSSRGATIWAGSMGGWAGVTCLSEDSPRLAHASDDGNIEIWDWERREQLSVIAVKQSAGRRANPRIEPHGPLKAILPNDDEERLSPLSFAAKGEKLFLRRFTPGVGVTREEWEVASGRQTRFWRRAENTRGVVFSPDSQYSITVEGTDTLVRTELDSGTRTPLQLDLSNTVPQGSFSWDGSLFAVPTWNGLVHVVNVDPLRRVVTLSGFLASINSSVFSPDGRRLATGSGGSDAMMLWDVGSYEKVLSIEVAASRFRQAAFSRDGNVLGVLGGTLPKSILHLWRAPTLAEIEAAEKQKKTPK